MTAAEVAAVLGDTMKEGREYRCRCPVHGGTAFTIRDGKNGIIIWTCWAGCDRIEVARALHELKLLPGDDDGHTTDRPRLAPRNDGEPDKDEANYVAERRDLARWLWRQRLPLTGTLAERYLCATRGLGGPFPCTLGFKRASGNYPPALIAAYGLPIEPEPGVLELPLEAVQGVQLISLSTDARKLGKPITIGRCPGSPIVLAPMGDSVGLVLTEGLEDAASMAEATGLGAWAAGGASRFAALAETVPTHTDWITVMQDDDPAGIRGVGSLIAGLIERGCWRPEQIERVLLGAREGQP